MSIHCAIPSSSLLYAGLPTPITPTTPSPRPLRIDTQRHAASSLPTPRSSSPQSSASAVYPYFRPGRSQRDRDHREDKTTLLSPADPYADPTRLRLRPQRHACLYPGARFTGSQRSGKHSYDVAVTLLNVDLPAAHLCGYLRIRGLTEDYPELTTYFDAQLVGAPGPHTFRTPREWGASDHEDWAHWARFPAFRGDAPRALDEGGVVFMRWKEKFLVPDHRVKDICGASFAGFYYICVEMDPSRRRARRSASLSPSPPYFKRESVTPAPFSDPMPAPFPPLLAPPQSTRPPPSPKPDARALPREITRFAPVPVVLEPPPPVEVKVEEEQDDEDEDEDMEVEGEGAVMTGFYFHPCSEPFQQLTLRHVKEDGCGVGSAGWEFR